LLSYILIPSRNVKQLKNVYLNTFKMVLVENVKLIIYISNEGWLKVFFIYPWILFLFRTQRWPIIVNETSYEHIIGDQTKPFYYDLFGMKFEANLQSYGISNLTAYETIYAEVLKLCNFEPNSTIFLQYFSDLGLFFSLIFNCVISWK
jgi:hypothetical protein